MPYIPEEARGAIDGGAPPLSVGELTYVVYKAAVDYAHQSIRQTNYATWAECIAALECARLELYRRHVAPYEDGAIERNGDVLP